MFCKHMNDALGFLEFLLLGSKPGWLPRQEGGGQQAITVMAIWQFDKPGLKKEIEPLLNERACCSLFGNPQNGNSGLTVP